MNIYIIKKLNFQRFKTHNESVNYIKSRGRSHRLTFNVLVGAQPVPSIECSLKRLQENKKILLIIVKVEMHFTPAAESYNCRSFTSSRFLHFPLCLGAIFLSDTWPWEAKGPNTGRSIMKTRNGIIKWHLCSKKRTCYCLLLLSNSSIGGIFLIRHLQAINMSN